MTNLPSVSILLVTKNGERYLAEILQRIHEQQGNFRLTEIIAVDSGSRDRTLSILKEHAVCIVQIPPQTFGHGKTRNLAASHAQGDYLVFLTQDATPPIPPGWRTCLRLWWPTHSSSVPIVVTRHARTATQWSGAGSSKRSCPASCTPASIAGSIIRTMTGVRSFLIFFPIPAPSFVATLGVASPGPRSNLARISCGPNAFSKPAIRPPIARIRSCIIRTVTDRGSISVATLTIA